MKQKWFCDFCGFKDEDKIKVGQHEEECFLNPANKGCFTCKHHGDHFSPIFGSAPFCEKGREDFAEIKEEELSCPSWEIEV